MDIKKLLGKRIQEIRKNKKFTQEYLAEIIGIETTSLSSIENGRYQPTAENLEKILSALGTTPEELFKIEHLQDTATLKSEINNILDANPDKVQTAYKLIRALAD